MVLGPETLIGETVMHAFLLAQDRVPEASYISFAVISMAYLFLMWLVIHKGSGTELIGLGLLTMVATVGYGSLVQPAGPLMVPTMVRIAFLLILGGVIAQVLKHSKGLGSNSPDSTPKEPSRD